MFKSRKKRVPLEVEAEEPRKPASMDYKRYTCLTTIKMESPEPQQVQAKKEEEEVSYLDLDFKEENIVQAMVYSEIFGEPKSKRRKR